MALTFSCVRIRVGRSLTGVARWLAEQGREDVVVHMNGRRVACGVAEDGRVEVATLQRACAFAGLHGLQRLIQLTLPFHGGGYWDLKI